MRTSQAVDRLNYCEQAGENRMPRNDRRQGRRLLSAALYALAGSLLFAQTAGAASLRPSVPPGAAVFEVAAIDAGGAVLLAAREAPPAGLAASVGAWIGALAAQKPFAAWKGAAVRYEALGPGTHGWLATLTDAGGRPVGYLIAYAAPDGTYRLGEYGTGAQPLFDQAALTRTLVENGLLPDERSPYAAAKSYLHPFAAVWTVRIGSATYWADAKSTELLPLDEAEWQKLASVPDDDGEPPMTKTVERLRLNETFDPYEKLPWLTGVQPIGRQDGELTGRLDRQLQLRYVSEPFGDRMLYALPVVGYLQWSGGRIDLALGMDGTRFVPLAELRRHGFFYP